MSQRITPGSLVLYKSRPARVTEIADKIAITLPDAKTKRVRDKDVELLHPGPVRDLGGLDAGSANLDEAWELLCGETVALAELAELLYGDFTPETAWSSWQLVADGLYFEGTPEAVTGRSADRVAADRAEREEKAVRQAAWDELIARLQQGGMAEEDRKELAEVERLALGYAASSRILQTLNIGETGENAHRFLTRVGYWAEEYNPHPQRMDAPLESPRFEIPDLLAPDLTGEARLDLTHLPALAIDDVGSEDPDDAVSIDGDRLWVHVADAAALVAPDSDLDREARGRGANLYLPEGVITMLPEAATWQLGLGLQEISPALSIGMRVDEQGVLQDIEIRLTRIRVTRLSYREAEGRLGDAPLRDILAVTRRFRARRMANDAAVIDLPEASIRIEGGEILIRPIESLTSREMVTDAMLMAGEAVARYALDSGLPLAFVGQPAPEEIRRPDTPATMYAYRRLFKPSQATTLEQPHFGLGLEVYTRVTSPLRRYLDLLNHQQLRRHLRGETPIPREELGQRIAESAAGAGRVRRTERVANQHWKLAWLKRRPNWEGEAVVVSLEGRRATILVPELALESRIRSSPDLALDARIRVAIREVDLPALEARWQKLG